MAAISSNGTSGGNWSAGTSWIGGVAPTSADDVTVVSGDKITLNITGMACNTLTVNSGGTLDCVNNANWDLTSEKQIFCADGSTLTVDMSANVAYSGSINLNNLSDNAGSNDYELIIDTTATVTIKGYPRTRKTDLVTTLTAASSTSGTVSDATGWQIGDVIIFGATGSYNATPEIDIVTLTSVDTVTGAIGWTGAVTYNHAIGGTACNFSSNLTIRPANTADWASVTYRIDYATTPANNRIIDNVEFYYGGANAYNNYGQLCVPGASDSGGWDDYKWTISNNVFYQTNNAGFNAWTYPSTKTRIPFQNNVFYSDRNTLFSDGAMIWCETPYLLDMQDCAILRSERYGIGGDVQVQGLKASDLHIGSCDNAALNTGLELTTGLFIANATAITQRDSQLLLTGLEYSGNTTNENLTGITDIIHTNCVTDRIDNAGLSSLVSDAVISWANKNNDITSQEEYTSQYTKKRDNILTNRSDASISIEPTVTGVDCTHEQAIVCADGETITVVGYMRVDSTFYNLGTWTAPTVTLSGLGETPVTATATSAANGAWEQYTASITNNSGGDGEFTLTYTANANAVTGGVAYFDGVPDYPWVSKCRHYGYVIEETNPVRTTNPYTSASEATAAGYASNFTITGTTTSTGTIQIDGVVTVQEMYDYLQYWACLPANLDYKIPLTTSDGRNFTTGDGYRIVIAATGDLTVNPELYTLVADASGPRPFISNAGTLTLGVKTGSVYTSGTAIRDEYETASSDYWRTGLYGTMVSTANGSTVEAYGASIEAKSSISIGGGVGGGASDGYYITTVYIERLTIKNIGTADMQLRFDNATGSTINVTGLTLDGITNPFVVLFAQDYDSFSTEFLRGQLQSFVNQPSDLTFTGLQFTDNTDATDVLFNGNSASADDVFTITDSDLGTSLAVDYSATNYRGALALQSTLNMTLLDVAGSPITSAKYYLADTNNSDRADPSGRADIDWLTSRTYEDSFDGSGQAIAVILIGSVTNTGTTPPVISYSYRCITGDSTDDFKYITTAYGYLPTVNPVVLKGYEQVSNQSRALADGGITEATRATVAAYTGFAWAGYITTISSDHSVQQWYDWNKWMESEYPSVVAFNSDTSGISSSDGTNFTPAAATKIRLQANLTGTATIIGGEVQIDTGGDFANTVTLNGTTLNFLNIGTYDYRSKSFSGTIELVNSSGGAVTVKLDPSVSYINTGPTITVEATTAVTITAANLIDGTRVQLYNVTQAAELDNSLVSGALGYSYTATLGIGEECEDGDTIRLRATYQSGTTAKEPILSSGVVSTGGLGFVDTQVDDAVYSTYGLDGSTITKFGADYADVEIDLIVSSNFAASEAYAWYCYILTTIQGIAEFFGAITPEDEANLRINTSLVSLMWDNDTASNVYQTDNIRMYRDDAAYPVKDPTTGGGGIDLVWRSKVYGYAAATGLTSAQETTLNKINTIEPRVGELWKLDGLDLTNPMTVTPTSRTAGSIVQTISGDGETTTTVTRT